MFKEMNFYFAHQSSNPTTPATQSVSATDSELRQRRVRGRLGSVVTTTAKASGRSPVRDAKKIFFEQMSGAVADRPGLHEALDYARSGDTLVVWKLDRLAGCGKSVFWGRIC